MCSILSDCIYSIEKNSIDEIRSIIPNQFHIFKSCCFFNNINKSLQGHNNDVDRI